MKALFATGAISLIVMFIGGFIDYKIFGPYRRTLLTYLEAMLLMFGVVCIVIAAIMGLYQWGFGA